MTDPNLYVHYGYQPADALVTAPGEGFSGWWSRMVAIVRRSWRRIFGISVVTYGIPAAVFLTIANLSIPRVTTTTDVNGVAHAHITGGSIGLLVVSVVALAFIAGYLSAVANAAVIWTVTRESAGQPAPFGDAMRYGLRNGARLWGWGLLFGLVVLAGTCACVVPGLYCALAGCLYAPIALFDRGANPISTSFSLVNKNFGASLGRMAALLGCLYGVQLVISIPVFIVSIGSRVAGQILGGVLDLVSAPLGILFAVGTVVLYAELRAKLYPTSAASMAAALG